MFKVEYKNEVGRAYHPELKDIRSHIALDTHKSQQSRLDQTQAESTTWSVCDRSLFQTCREWSSRSSSHPTMFKVEYKNEVGRGYHSELKGIRSHIALATHKPQQSRFDQTQLAHKVKAWSESQRPPATIKFPSYVAACEPSKLSDETVIP